MTSRDTADSVSRTGPLVSIVVPVFNQADYVEEALESVLTQRYSQIELIVLDDGSTDDTPQRLEAYRSRCVVERHSNIGQAATLNKGWNLSHGQILSYLAADDMLLPGAVQASIEVLERRSDVVMSYCDYELMDPASKYIRRITTRDYAFPALVVELVCLPGPGVFFRRSAFEATGPWNAALRQIPDFEYWLRLALKGPFVRIPQVLARYRVHDDSQSFARVAAERAEEPVGVVRRFYAEEALPAEITARRGEAMCNAHLLTARLHFRAGRWRAGTQHLWAAVRKWPRTLLRLRTHHLMVNALINRFGHRLFWEINRLRGRSPGET
jgi:glycosyltransferase involved in cell wall biosynthesis